MTEQLTKAKLTKIVDKQETVFEVQFNPETLKVSYANQLEKPSNQGADDKAKGKSAAPKSSGGKKAQPPTAQYVGKGTTKLTVQLWFDITGELAEADRSALDVRVLTERVVNLIKPVPNNNASANSADAELMKPPQVRFQWGTFLFEGIADSVEESLEFWSADGRPLRASVSLSLSQQRLEFLTGQSSAQAAPSAGTRRLTPAPAGSTIQALADARGQGNNWQAIAQANGIENPRNLTPGQLIDFRLA